jgi:hypothetical protein
MRDTALRVNVCLDDKLLAPATGPLWFHPLTNEASTGIAVADFTKFLAATGHEYTPITF